MPPERLNAIRATRPNDSVAEPLLSNLQAFQASVVDTDVSRLPRPLHHRQLQKGGGQRREPLLALGLMGLLLPELGLLCVMRLVIAMAMRIYVGL